MLGNIVRGIPKGVGPSVRYFSSHRLAFANFGEPKDVLKMEEQHLDKVKPEQAIVKMLGSPVNPADINTVQGTYPAKPTVFPAVPGIEGVGQVIKVGKGNNPLNLAEGQWVIPEHPLVGSWQGYCVGMNEEFLPIPKMDLALAATISINPETAFRMLKDFEQLKKGDTVIQNGGNSAVGQAVIQLCRIWGLKSVSVVRNRDGFEALKKRLIGLGDANTTVVTEEELKDIGKKVKAQLALNCVGGKSGTSLFRSLEPGRSHVTYGGMSFQPVTVPTSQLIFNDVKVYGFWLTRWSKVTSMSIRMDTLNACAKYCLEGKFTPPPHKFLPIAKYGEAIENALKGYNQTKYILTFDK